MLYFGAMKDFLGQSIAPGPKAVTIGIFDGLHLGHRELIAKVVAVSRREKIPGALLTFDPHPMKILFPEKEIKMIFDLNDRASVAKSLGLHHIIVESFNRALSEMEPKAFFEKILLSKIQVKYLFVGYNFSFGKNRSGTLDLLKQLCEKNAVVLMVVPPVKMGDEIISSSKVRMAVLEGKPAVARAYLARPFYLKGEIEKGAGRGKKIGFPTANLMTKAELLPKKGVYTTTVEIDGGVFNSVTNVGDNPTFEEKNRRPVQVESHLLNFAGDLYGKTCKVNFMEYLRPEIKFGSVDQLIEAIKKDVKEAGVYFGKK